MRNVGMDTDQSNAQLFIFFVIAKEEFILTDRLLKNTQAGKERYTDRYSTLFFFLIPCDVSTDAGMLWSLLNGFIFLNEPLHQHAHILVPGRRNHNNPTSGLPRSQVLIPCYPAVSQKTRFLS